MQWIILVAFNIGPWNKALQEVYRSCMNFVKIVHICETLLCKHFQGVLDLMMIRK